MAINAEPYSVNDINTITNGAIAVRISTKGRFGVDGSFAEGGMPGQIDAFEKMLKVIAAVKKMKMTHEPWPKVPGSPFVYCGAVRAGRGETTASCPSTSTSISARRPSCSSPFPGRLLKWC